jgi:hypothetical protein
MGHSVGHRGSSRWAHGKLGTHIVGTGKYGRARRLLPSILTIVWIHTQRTIQILQISPRGKVECFTCNVKFKGGLPTREEIWVLGLGTYELGLPHTLGPG